MVCLLDGRHGTRPGDEHPCGGLIGPSVRQARAIVAHVRIAYTGTATDGERLAGPLRAVGPRLIDTLHGMPCTASGSICNDPAAPHAYYGTSAMLREMDATAVQAVLDLTGPGAPATCIVQLNHLGGALARPPAVSNAVGHRDARYLLRVVSPLGEDDHPSVRTTTPR